MDVKRLSGQVACIASERDLKLPSVRDADYSAKGGEARFRRPILGMPLNSRSMIALACSRQLRFFLARSQ
jgi:hypothetical protein